MILVHRDSQNDLYKDFVVAYNNTLKSLGKKACLVEKSELIRLAMDSKAPRYYISTDRARKFVSKYLKTGEIDSSYKEDKRMIKEIVEKYYAEVDKNPKKSMSLILEEIIYSEASSFFISRTKAYYILHRYYAKKK